MRHLIEDLALSLNTSMTLAEVCGTPKDLRPKASLPTNMDVVATTRPGWQAGLSVSRLRTVKAGIPAFFFASTFR